MPRKSKQPKPSTTSSRALRSQVNTHVTYCLHCDTQYGILSSKCPFCWLPIQSPIVLPRPANYYDDPDVLPASSSFRNFSRLPTEVRIMIWIEALYVPRMVQISASKFYGLIPHYLDKLDCMTNKLWAASPYSIALLYVCHESYEVVRTHYTQAFTGDEGVFPQMWFNFEIDTLYFDLLQESDIRSSKVWRGDFLKVKHLATMYHPRPGIETVSDRIISSEYLDTEAWIAAFLEGSVVEDITFLIDRTPDHNIENATLIECQDIDSLLAFYQQPYNPADEVRFEAQHDSYIKKLWEASNFDLQMLDYFKANDVVNRSSIFPKSLWIRYMMMTTNSLGERLEKSEGQFELKKLEYERANPGETPDDWRSGMEIICELEEQYG